MLKKIPIIILLLILLISLSSAGSNTDRIQYPVVAGRFYPAQKKLLAEQIDNFIISADNFTPSDKTLGMMVPHAGYVYSGSVAGYAYKYIKKHRYKTVVIIAPSHFVNMNGVSVLDKDYYSTPLGLIPVDTSLVNKLIQSADWIQYNPELYKKEHSLEVHIPFIQKSVKDVKIVPIVMGNHSIELAKSLAEVLHNIIGKEDVFYIASSDMSHYFPYETANAMDAHTLNVIKTLDSTTLYNEARIRKTELCGLGPVITLMELFKKFGGKKVEVLKYANSGDTAGTKDKVVGYGTAAFILDDALSLEDKKRLIEIAKVTVAEYVKQKKIPKIEVSSPVLKAKGAAFVTLKKNGKLRGCIGHLIARMPLYLSVQEMAVAACSKDSRFKPVTPDELDQIEVEISVMTPMQKVNNIEEITVGRDGLLIRKGSYQGVLLPQVPVEYGWTREQFLRRTSQKAGLPPDAWKNGADLFKFQAIVFSETDMKEGSQN